MAQDLIVVKVERARALLAAARDATDAKQVSDMACAAEVYAKRQHLSEEVIRYATAVKVDAMTLMGEFLQATPKNKGAAAGGKKDGPRGTYLEPRDSNPTLASAGISKKESAEARALADLKKGAPELYEQVRGGQATVSQARAERKRQQRNADAQSEITAPLPILTTAGLWRVDQADGLEWLRSQPADSLNLVFGSPPHERGRHYREDGEDRGIVRTTEEWVEWMVQVYEASLKCCNGLVAFVVAGKTRNYSWSASPALLMAALIAKGITLRAPPLYRRVGIPGSGGPDWLRSDYEFVICATRGGKLAWSDSTAMGHVPKFKPGGFLSQRQQNGTWENDPTADGTPQLRPGENTCPIQSRDSRRGAGRGGTVAITPSATRSVHDQGPGRRFSSAKGRASLPQKRPSSFTA